MSEFPALYKTHPWMVTHRKRRSPADTLSILGQISLIVTSSSIFSSSLLLGPLLCFLTGMHSLTVWTLYSLASLAFVSSLSLSLSLT